MYMKVYIAEYIANKFKSCKKITFIMYHTDTEHAYTQMWCIIVWCNKCAPERET